jgi:hypothetical protein
MDNEKFVYGDAAQSEISSHWGRCEKNKSPFIIVQQKGKGYTGISYDITNYNIDLNNVSESIKSIYKGYMEFSLIPFCDVEDIFYSTYFFDLIVRNEHAQCIASMLYDYLYAVIHGKWTLPCATE